MAKLKALQESATKNRKLYQYARPDPSLLETFPSRIPMVDRRVAVAESRRVYQEIEIRNPEFTSLCPMTGQPDFGELIIRYRPKEKCIESKSLKLYLMGYRQHGAFAEVITNQIMDDLVKVLRPLTLRVTGTFTPRGGLSFSPTSYYVNPSYQRILDGGDQPSETIARL